jgi:hypothetical protein
MTPPEETWVVFDSLPRVLKGWLALPAAIFGKKGTQPGVAGQTPPAASKGVKDNSDLLRRRMAALHLDPDDVDRPTARLMGIETGLCGRCESRDKCMRDLADEFGDPGWGDWRNYCPNATTLSILSTLRECVEQEQERSRIKTAAQ